MKEKLTKKLLKWIIMNNYKENYRLIAIDLSKKTKIKDPQQINFTGKFEIEGHNNGVTMFFIIEKSEETTFEHL